MATKPASKPGVRDAAKDRTKGSATPRRVSGPATKLAAESSANKRSAPERDGRRLVGAWRRYATPVVDFTWGWFIALVAALVCVAAIAFGSRLGLAGAIAALVLPAVITFVWAPTSRRKAWRWLVVWVIAEIVVAPLQFQALLVGEAWVIRQAWVVERPRITRTKRRDMTDLLRRARREGVAS